MARKPKENKTRSHKIYALISSASNEFFVGKTYATDPNVAYKNHASLKNQQTKKLFSDAKKTQNFPKMYLLEEVNVTQETAYGYCVAWTKYFVEQGLTPLANDKVLTYIEELTEENETIYNCIKDVPIGSVLSDEHLLRETWKAKEKKEKPSERTGNKDQRVTLNLTMDNLELLSNKAKEAKMSLSKYCLTMALNGYVATINVWEYLDALRDFTDVLQKILLAILQHGKYYPADLDNILKLLEMVIENEKKVVKTLKQETEKLVGYKKLQLENARLKNKIKELEKELERVTTSHPHEQEDAYEDDKN